MTNFNLFHSLLRCPNCHSIKLNLSENKDNLNCLSCGIDFPFSFERPILFRQDNEVFNLDNYRNANPFTHFKKGLSRFIPSSSVNLSSKSILERLRKALFELPAAMVLVVGGGQQRKSLDTSLGAGSFIKIIYSDIDINSDVDLFCDGHDLPFIDNCFDAIVTTAVLEHVLYPERVVSEMHRVLKTGGKIYSELPFIQQVHEGAYDFTRYTLSGHRRLLNGFAETESGMVAGPGTAMVWTIENFILAFISKPVLRPIAKALARILFFWIKYFDYLVKDKPEAMDSASCTFFYGDKIDGRVKDINVIKSYVGAKHLKHT